MLALTRKPGQTIRIGEATVYVNAIRGGAIKLAVAAPKHITIMRGELPFPACGCDTPQDLCRVVNSPGFSDDPERVLAALHEAIGILHRLEAKTA